MQRLASMSLISRTVLHLHHRTINLWCNTGYPLRWPSCVIALLHNKGIGLYSQSLLMAKRNKQLNYSTRHDLTHGNSDDVRTINQQSTVKCLVDLYMVSRETSQSFHPLSILDAVTRSIKKSAKQSTVLLHDPDVTKNFDTLLKDINDNIDASLQTVLGVLCSVAEISARQKAYLNKTGFGIYPGHVTSTEGPHSNHVIQTREAHLTESGKTLFLEYQSVILKEGLDNVENEELVRILWSFVETELGSKELFDALKNRILEQKYSDYTMKDISQIACSFAKLKSTINISEAMVSMKKELLNRGLVGLRSNEITDILFSFVNTEQGHFEFYEEIKKDILSRDVRSHSPAQLCQILWSFAKVKEKHDLDLSDLINQFEDEILRRGVKRFDDRGLAVITWSFVEVAHFSNRLFTLLRNEIMKRNVRDLIADDLSVLLRSFAKVKNKITSHQFFAKVDKELLHRGFDGFTNRHLATTLWSFAKTGNGTHAFYNILKQEVVSRNIQDFTATEFSQTLWSFAKAREKVDTTDLFEQVSYDLSKLSLRQLALSGWSLAVTDVFPVKLFTELRREISKKDVSTASNPVICQIVYAFAASKDVVPLGRLSESIEERVINSGAKAFGNRQLAVLVWSFGELKDVCKSTQIYEALEKEACNRPFPQYMPGDFCRILWGFAQVRHVVNTTVVFYSMTKELLRRGLWEFSIAQLTMATVALTKAGEWDDDLLNLFKDEITRRKNSRHFESLHLCSLAQSFASMNPLETNDLYLWLEDEIVGRNACTLLPRELTEILRILLDRKATKLQFFETVKEQLLTGRLVNYDEDDLRNVSMLLGGAGVNTGDLEMKAGNMR